MLFHIGNGVKNPIIVQKIFEGRNPVSSCSSTGRYFTLCGILALFLPLQSKN